MGLAAAGKQMEESLVELGKHVPVPDEFKGEIEVLAKQIQRLCSGQIVGVVTSALIMSFLVHIKAVGAGNSYKVGGEQDNKKKGGEIYEARN